MQNQDFKVKLESRTKDFSIALINLLKSFPYVYIDQKIADQLLRSGTSIGANYREANRAESKKDFIHKIGIVEKEASETCYWLELIKATWKTDEQQSSSLKLLIQESDELLALFTTISRNSKKNPNSHTPELLLNSRTSRTPELPNFRTSFTLLLNSRTPELPNFFLTPELSNFRTSS